MHLPAHSHLPALTLLGIGLLGGCARFLVLFQFLATLGFSLECGFILDSFALALLVLALCNTDLLLGRSAVVGVKTIIIVVTAAAADERIIIITYFTFARHCLVCDDDVMMC